MFLSQLQKKQKAVIKTIDIHTIPLKLIEFGCLPESQVELIQVAPLGCPLYFIINGSRVAIRKELAQKIKVEILSL